MEHIFNRSLFIYFSSFIAYYFTFNIVQKSTVNQNQRLTSCVQASAVKSEQIVWSEEIKENEMQCKNLVVCTGPNQL